MKLLINIFFLSVLIFCVFQGCKNKQIYESNSVSGKYNMVRARAQIESLDKQFSKDYYNGDSLALVNYYSSDAKFGTLKGKEILTAWGRMVRNSVKDSTRNLLFVTTALTGDSDFVVELGNYVERNDKNELKNRGKYLVVRKLVNGQWKIYRDIGL